MCFEGLFAFTTKELSLQAGGGQYSDSAGEVAAFHANADERETSGRGQHFRCISNGKGQSSCAACGAGYAIFLHLEATKTVSRRTEVGRREF